MPFDEEELDPHGECAAEIKRLQEVVPIWMTAHGYATGHGDTIEDMLAELEAQAIARGSADQQTGTEPK